ncbi:MAG TPA: hypothetical protein PLR17_03615 [Acetomicrobium flavidum]|uniref:Uncharacterized protein n=2 Tax=Acetomicrobium TaxID=49894 RepID=I4BTU5_ACEMN|nr:hypothetical protein [Acetomicrobium mobile]SIN67691.1 hypothetical protein SAMN05444368_1088 [Acetomicrobium flavidum]AFM20702.1 hypothetical protein Anamo_0029 [Acetomicrobium mobile DSM 13181]HOJ82158.1 hypothetical protein [Acetomicrobium flavidum]HOM31091.1 hypothetical protein [Acetomicrobium flavidum]HOP87503.1 hypothetical protein [Acetomicrobium flavidum]
MNSVSTGEDLMPLGNVVALVGAENKTLIYMRNGDIRVIGRNIRSVVRKYQELRIFLQDASIIKERSML